MIPRTTRACPLCGAVDGASVSEETWDIVGVGPVVVGFRICGDCGLVREDPVLPRDRMLEHYADFSNYTNPGRDGRPSAQKERNVARQVAMAGRNTERPGRVFQAGCSDGYTLSRFREAGWQVDGIDPSRGARAVAHGQYDLETRIGDFESAVGLRECDLFVATHVLEHVYDPVGFLAKAATMLAPGGRMLLEVPCLVLPDSWPNGYLTLEHVQYFSPNTLAACLAQVGLAIVDQEIHTERLPYPIICVIAARTEAPWTRVRVADESEPDRARRLLEVYCEREWRTGWRRIDREILPRLDRYGSICVWGAGIHTSQLLARTSLSRRPLRYVVDSDRQKHGRRLAGLPVRSPDEIEPDEVDAIVISTLGSEPAVWQATRSLRARGVDVVRLYARDGACEGAAGAGRA